MIGVVTDSSSGLPTLLSEICQQWGVASFMERSVSYANIPLTVTVDGRDYVDTPNHRKDLLQSAFARKARITTSQPSPGAFHREYDVLERAGVEHIFSLHLSEKLSGTVNSARLAATASSVPVTVIDTRSVAMGLGFLVLQLLDSLEELIRSGSQVTISEEKLTEWISESPGTDFCVDSLEHLRRGGRINRFSSVMGDIFSLKPVLSIVDGAVVFADAKFSIDAAVARLADMAVTKATVAEETNPAGSSASVFEGQWRVALEHVFAPEQAQNLKNELASRPVFERADIVVLPASAVLSAHAGPGSVAISLYRR